MPLPRLAQTDHGGAEPQSQKPPEDFEPQGDTRNRGASQATEDFEDFEDLWQGAPFAYLVTDTRGRITRVNDTFVTWTGHPRDTLLGRPLTAFLPAGDRILYLTSSVPQLALTGRLDEVALQVLGADGVKHAALLTATRVSPRIRDGRRLPTEVRVALFSAAGRRRYEEDLLAARRRAEASEARRAEAEAGLQRLVHHDALTGLLNRSGLLRQLHSALTPPPDPAGEAGTTEHRWPPTIAVLFVDLDGFKTVNDSLGHEAGDELLVVVADRLRSIPWGETTIARLAGDEFAIVTDVSTRADLTDADLTDADLTDADLTDAVGVDDAESCAEVLAQRVLDALCQPVLLNGVEVMVSASVGVALSHPHQEERARAGPPARFAGDELDVATAGSGSGADPAREADLLLRRADVAMYAAKARGRAGWRIHDASIGDPTADRLLLLEQLRHGITDDELRLHYQPRIDLRTGLLDGVEALVRWQHPTRGLLPPITFIGIAEQSGLIRDLGAWVLETAVAQIAHWDRNPSTALLRMAVNVSARQLADPHLVDLVTRTLARHGLAASRLVLEITETALMSEPTLAMTALTALADLGVGLAIDDFGTGYSSLTYLKQFPVHELKIDQSFVAGLTHDDGDHAIVANCVHLAHAMGMTALAEGVETHAQRDRLTSLGCDQAQGYLFGRPTPPEQLVLHHLHKDPTV